MKKFYTHLLCAAVMLLLGVPTFAQVTGLTIDSVAPCYNKTINISWTDGGANSTFKVRVGTGLPTSNTDLLNIPAYGMTSISVGSFVPGVTYYVTIIGNSDLSEQNTTFLVDSRPTAPTAIAASIDTVCSGSTVSLSATGGNVGTNGGFSWYAADGTTFLGYGTPTSPAIVGNTVFKVRRTDEICGDSTSLVSFTIYNYTPAVAATDVTLNTVSNNPVVKWCAGSYNIGQTGAPGTGVHPSTTIDFSVTGFGMSNLSSPYTNPFASGSSTTVYVRVTDGCGAVTQDYSEVVNTYISASVAGATVTPTMPNFCTGASVTWNVAGATIGDVPATYQYSLNGTTWNPTTTGGADAFWTINPVNATTTVYFRLVSACDTTSSISATATAYVNPTDVDSVAVNPNQLTVCAGTPVTFTAINGNLGTHPGSYYEYSVNAAPFVNNTNNPVYGMVVSATTNVAWRIFNGCTSTSTTGDNVTMNVATNNTAPSVINTTDINGGSICAGDTFDFQAIGMLSNTTYNPLAYWEFASDAGFTTILEDSSLTGLYTGSIGSGITVYARIAGGCGGTTASVNTTVTPVGSSLAPTSIQVWDAGQTTQYTAGTEICTQTVTLVQVGGNADQGDGATYDFGTMNNGVFALLANTGTTGTYTYAHSIDTVYAVRRNGGCSGTTTPVTIAMGVAEDNATPDSMNVSIAGAWVADSTQLCGSSVVDYTIATLALGDNADYTFDVDVDGSVTTYYNGTNATLSIAVDTMNISMYMTVTGYVDGGCTNVSGTTFSHTVNVFGASSGFTAISLTNDNFCANSGVVATLKATGASIPGNANTVWYTLDNITNAIVSKVKESSGLGSDTIMVSPTVTTTYGARIEGCDTTVFEVRSVTVRDTSVAPTSISISPGTLVCPGMPVSFTASGGAVGFGAMAKWYNGATPLGSGNPLFLNVSADTSVTVRYEGFCNTTVSFASATVTVYDSNDVSVLMPGSVCPNASFDLNTLVSPTGGSFSGTGVAGHFFNYATPGTYGITYTKTFAGGCSFSRTVYVTVNASPVFDLALQSAPTGCNGVGSFLITGTPGDAYDVNSGEHTGTLDGAGEALISDSAGSYNVVVTSGLSCPSSDTVSIPSAPGSVSAYADITHETCFGASNGSITVNASAGTAPYTYSFEGGAFGSEFVFDTLAAGFYDIDVKDANGCIVSLNEEVEGVANAIDLTVQYSSDVTCFGANDGTIQGLTASGGNGPYTFSLNGDEYTTEDSFVDLPAANYTVYVKDANGCIAQFSYSISSPAQLVGVVELLGYDENDNTYDVEIAPQGGTGLRLITLNGGTATADSVFNDLAPGVYTWSIVDENNCSTSGQFELVDPSSVDVVTANTELSVYPNPFAGELTIAGKLPVNAVVSLLDSYGKKVAVNVSVSNERTVISTDGLAKGMYILNINGEGLNISRKVIKN